MAGLAAEINPPGSPCKLCNSILTGKLDAAIAFLEDRETILDPDGTAVYLIVKHYSKLLAEFAQQSEIALANAWQDRKLRDGESRRKVLKALKLMFRGGLSANCITGDETALLCAISTHDEELVKLMMENGADPNFCTPCHRMNALALAVILNEASLLKLILSYGAKINEPCCENLTPLQLSMHKSVEVSKALLQNGADVQQVMQMRGATDVLLSKPPLIHAVETDNKYLASVLLEHGEDINQTYGQFSNSPLHFAVSRRNADMSKLLIQYGANLDKRNGRGCTPFGLALHQPEAGKELCEALLAAGCSWRKGSMINVFQRHFPPFHIAAFLGYDFHFDIIKLLLSLSHHSDDTRSFESLKPHDRHKHSLSNSERESDLKKRECQKFINLQAMDKSTALIMSVLGGNLQIAQYLHGQGADPYVYCCHGNLLHAAVMASKMGKEMLDFALNFKFDINILNDDGNTPLILAARNSNSSLCKTLVQKGAILNIRDGRFGETALSVSVYFGFESNAETLISHGANPDIPDSRDTTALYWAIFNSREKTLRLLLEAGAKLTPADLSRYPKNIKVMKNPALKSLLHDYVSQPASLQQCCRLATRKLLSQVHTGKSIMSAMMSLPVPLKMKDYIALKSF